MSRRNQSRRRRAYGRRQHELGERRGRPNVRLFIEDDADWPAKSGRRLPLGERPDERAADDQPLAGA